MEQFNKGTDHALVSQRFSLIKRLGPEPHRRPQSRPLRP